MGQRQAGVDGARRSADGGRILSWVRREWVEAGSDEEGMGPTMAFVRIRLPGF